ncbi:uncharacterized protein LOC129592720 [Paramacrobiotus metropolitanus]|uniref:uncharacterized protein LOC129592720 n=1 Tax=Paramacrobiotus metropolitanus TaxID=2943436 RepID=UPI0024457375|nr:uncharacterized protein LOC129592720 [Paramacrobiotus metropolitanus]
MRELQLIHLYGKFITFIILTTSSCFLPILVSGYSDMIFGARTQKQIGQRLGAADTWLEGVRVIRKLNSDMRQHRCQTGAGRLPQSILCPTVASDEHETGSAVDPDSTVIADGNTRSNDRFQHPKRRRISSPYFVGLGRMHSGSEIGKLLSADTAAHSPRGAGRRRKRR